MPEAQRQGPGEFHTVWKMWEAGRCEQFLVIGVLKEADVL